MHDRPRVRLLLTACLLLAVSGCGSSVAPTQPAVRILAPTTGSNLPLTSRAVAIVTVRVSVSHFTLVDASGNTQPGSGQIRLYENGKAVAVSSTSSIRLDLAPGSYLLRAVLVTNGSVVATSATSVLSVSSLPWLGTARHACPDSPRGVTTGSAGAQAVSIRLFCLPGADTVFHITSPHDFFFVPDSSGNLWFVLGSTNDNSARGIARITPSGAMSVFTKGLPASDCGPDGPYPLTPGPGGLWFPCQGAIGRITRSGAITLFSKGLPKAGYLSDLTLGTSGDQWFTVYTGSGSSFSIGKITPAGAITLFTKGLPAGGYPGPLVPGPGDNLWFTVFGKMGGVLSIGRITPSGVISVFPTGLPAGTCSGLAGLTPDLGGNLWFAAGSSCRGPWVSDIGKIPSSGTVSLFSTGLPPAASCPTLGGLSLEYGGIGLTPGPGGDMWFTLSTGSGCGSSGDQASIGRITPSGTITLLTKGLPPAASCPNLSGLTPGSAGAMWFTVSTGCNASTTSIGRIGPSGTVNLFTKGLPAGDYLGRLVLGPGGNLWFTVYTGNGGQFSIGEITSSGTISLFTKSHLPGGNHLTSGPGKRLWFFWAVNANTEGLGLVTAAAASP